MAAALTGWLIGAGWYGVLGKQWMNALGWSEDEMSPKRKLPIKTMIISFIALLVTAYMLSGIMGHLGPLSVRSGAITGALVWLGFTITTMTVNNAFQMRKPMLTVIDGGNWLLVFVVQGAVIGWLGLP